MKRLSEILDKKNYKKLVSEYGGKRIWVPKNGDNGFHDKEYFETRNKTIISLRRQGMSVELLSKQFNISLKSVYNIAKGQKYSRKKHGYDPVFSKTTEFTRTL